MRERGARHATGKEVKLTPNERLPEVRLPLFHIGFTTLIEGNGRKIVDVARNDVTVFSFPAPLFQATNIPPKRLHSMRVDFHKRQVLEAGLMKADSLPSGSRANLD
jgi:hypothetical protein